MIHFDLTCSAGHEFDGWFRDAEAFDRQVEQKVLVCPVCGATNVEKRLMAPAVSGAKKREAAPTRFAAPDPRQQAMKEMMRELRRHIEANSDYVGNRFAEEARKIHYEEAEPRGIRGEATAEEAKALVEEGIEFHPLPPLPEDGN